MNNLQHLCETEPETVIAALLCNEGGGCGECKALGFCDRSDPRASREWLLSDHDGTQPCQTDGKTTAAGTMQPLIEERDDDVTRPLLEYGA